LLIDPILAARSCALLHSAPRLTVFCAQRDILGTLGMLTRLFHQPTTLPSRAGQSEAYLGGFHLLRSCRLGERTPFTGI
jgi:hypothetical protein